MNLKEQILKITKHFKSSKKEVSICKGVPISLLPMFKKYLKNKKVRYKYRGPSIPTIYDRPVSFCHKKYATSFAVYKR